MADIFSPFPRFTGQRPSELHPREMAPPTPLPVSATATAKLPWSHPPRAAAFLRQRRHSSGGSSILRLVFVQRRCNLYHQKVSRHLRDAAGRIRCSQLKLEDGVDDETCELVNGVELFIGEGEDGVRAYLLKAVKNNNGTGVLLLSDIFGFEDSSTREFAYRVACSGYNVLVPDLFRGNPWKKGQPKTEFEPWLTRHFPERVAGDITAASKWMADEFVAAGIAKKLGVIGFCYGGHHLIEALARDEHAYFGAGVCFYGTNMDPSLASNIHAPVLFVCGDDDPFCPVSVVRDMEKSIRDSKVVVYPGSGPGFAHRPESPEEDDDAEDAFARTRTWLHEHLIAE